MENKELYQLQHLHQRQQNDGQKLSSFNNNINAPYYITPYTTTANICYNLHLIISLYMASLLQFLIFRSFLTPLPPLHRATIFFLVNISNGAK